MRVHQPPPRRPPTLDTERPGDQRPDPGQGPPLILPAINGPTPCQLMLQLGELAIGKLRQLRRPAEASAAIPPARNAPSAPPTAHSPTDLSRSPRFSQHGQTVQRPRTGSAHETAAAPRSVHHPAHTAYHRPTAGISTTSPPRQQSEELSNPSQRHDAGRGWSSRPSCGRTAVSSGRVARCDLSARPRRRCQATGSSCQLAFAPATLPFWKNSSYPLPGVASVL